MNKKLIIGAVAFMAVMVGSIVLLGGKDNKTTNTGNLSTTQQQALQNTANIDKTYEESQYTGFDACDVFKQALGKVFPGQTLVERAPYKNFNATGEWINGCTVEGADPFSFTNVLTVRTYADATRAKELNRPVNELPDGSGYQPGSASSHADGATSQKANTFGYESTFLRYVLGNSYIELQVGGAAGVRDRVEQVATELDALIPPYSVL